jgi:4-hydroxy-3-polyprenylbenzoate decarboxylase
MFNKILVMTAFPPAPLNPSEGGTFISFKINDYEKLARDVFRNWNPATDIYFSQGPMDVLDHSCSKLGFGGKMCIDGTFKFDEEKDEDQMPDARCQISDLIMKERFKEINSINTSLLKKDIPCVIISLEKNRKNHVRELHEAICNLKEAEGIKMILYIEHTVDANDLTTALWRFCNNLDPKRDSMIFKRSIEASPNGGGLEGTFACIGLDGTRKTKQHDNFQRNWPNIIVADNHTIKAVDEKWDQLGIGEFIPSPSLKFKGQMYGEEAVVE